MTNDEIVRKLKPSVFAFYSATMAIFVAISFLLSYQDQVYVSTKAGFVVAFLLVLSMIVSRDLKSPDALLVIGTIFLVFAIYKSSLPTQAVFQNVRHLSLILSVVFAGLYLAVKNFGERGRRPRLSLMTSISRFFSVCLTTLSSELCSCLHPILLLEMIGIMAFLPSQVRIGFVLMMTTLVFQLRLTLNSLRTFFNRL